MTVAFEETPPVDLGEAAEALHLQQLEAALELGELLLDPGVGELRQRLGAQVLDHRSQLAHRCIALRSGCSSIPNGFHLDDLFCLEHLFDLTLPHVPAM